LTLSPRPAPATIEEQRARLPPPAECPDPVEGIWRSHNYNGRDGDWNIFTLTVRRTEAGGSRLKGSITNETWYGPETESVRGPCRGTLQYLVSMDAQGSVIDGNIDFGGVGEWRLDELFCGRLGGYNLDQFSGHIDPELLEFQTVNNDGGRYVNMKTVFRRVRCLEDPAGGEEKEPHVSVTPPPFYVPSETDRGGCGCNP
jgi:hypothetical protein